MSLQDAFESLSEFLNSLDEEAEQQLELSHSLVIVCPDCGKNVAFRNRCPKCGGDSWIPAGHAGGIFERMKVHRWREQIGVEDMDADGEPHGNGDAMREPVMRTDADERPPSGTTKPQRTPPPADADTVDVEEDADDPAK